MKTIFFFKVVYLSEMAKNAIESDFRSSKMAAGSHFVKKKLRIDLKWRDVGKGAGHLFLIDIYTNVFSSNSIK